ncbi:hypothetical protein [Conexibacter sp. S30A1]|uniref:hypothetical protein n=1 Tax=Conexibacter sp. S30A1 TaxID=2937800 RepID=UPI00200F155C|nr:hypothetical protein [Conexibacter sp. S30A1]
MTPEQLEQLRLRYRLAAAAADGYLEAGFTVALEDVVAGPLLGELRTMVRSRPCHIVVLLPSSEAIAARETARDHKDYGVWSVKQLRDGFVSETPRIGVWLDSSHLTPEGPSMPFSNARRRIQRRHGRRLSSPTTTGDGRRCSSR